MIIKKINDRREKPNYNYFQLNWLLLIIFSILRIADLYTTFIGISKGINESNSFSRYLLENNSVGVVIVLNIIPILIIALSNIFLINIKDNQLRYISISGLFLILIILNIIGGFCIINNCYELTRISGEIQV